MKYRVPGALALVLATAGVLAIQAQEQPAPPKLETFDQKMGYIFGYDLGQNLKQGGMTVDPEMLARGLKDAMAGTASAIDEKTKEAIVQEFQAKSQAAAQAKFNEQAAKNKAEGEAWLEKNKTAEGVQATASGLQYKVLRAGNGTKPTATSRVSVHYEGTLIDGTKFDSSYDRGKPMEFQLSQVVKGWTEGVQLMDVGSQYMLYVPAALGYGERSRPPIPPNSVLIFKVELLEIKQ